MYEPGTVIQDHLVDHVGRWRNEWSLEQDTVHGGRERCGYKARSQEEEVKEWGEQLQFQLSLLG